MKKSLLAATTLAVTLTLALASGAKAADWEHDFEKASAAAAKDASSRTSVCA